MIRIDIKGDNLTGWFGDAELVAMKPGVMAIGQIAGAAFVRYAKAELSHRGVGRTYRRVSGKKRRKIIQHQASLPGDPPALNKGKLRNSIKATKPRWRNRGTTLEVRVGSRLPQARALEYGGRVGRKLMVRLSARPFLRPAELKVNQEIDAKLASMPSS